MFVSNGATAMALELGDPMLWVIMIVIVIFAAVVYYELKIIRKKRKVKTDQQVQVDDIYNQIITSQAVARALRERGSDTRAAELTLIEAEAAYQRRSYTEAKSAAERAKSLLKDAKPANDLLSSLATVKAADSEGERREDLEVPFQEAKKLPQNYMESKFMISSVKDEAEEQEKAGKDVSAVRQNLAAANEAFGRADYTGALKYALRAKRGLEPEVDICPPAEAKVTDLAGTEKIPMTKVVKQAAIKCAFCGTEMESDDLFCRKCGKKVELRILCPQCDKEVAPDDAFCRKCGAPLRND